MKTLVASGITNTRTYCQALSKSKVLIVCGFLSLPGQANAASFESGDFTLDWDSVMTYGAQWRVQDRNDRLRNGSNGSATELENLVQLIDNAFVINGNDGNNNFDRNDVIAHRVSFLTEADLNWNGSTGVFIRAKAYYDMAYNEDTNLEAEDYNSYNANPRFGTNGGYNSRLGQFNEEAEDYMKSSARFLDVFLYHSIDIGERSLGLRIGRQTISWGESLLSGGGFTMAQNHVDAQIRNTPGLEIKELFLPNGTIFGQLDLSDSVTVQAYYQYEWQATVLDPATSYFSEFDAIGDGGHTFMFLTGDEEWALGYDLSLPENAALLDYLPKDNCLPGDKCDYLISHRFIEEDASDSGQFGIGFQWVLDSGDELGFYYANYHDKNPSFILPLDSVDKYAPMINMLLDPAFGANEVFTGPEDLGSNLSMNQLVLLLDFLGSIPSEAGGGSIAQIMTNMGVTEKDGVPIDFASEAIQSAADVVLKDAGLPQGLDSWVNSMDYRIKYFENIHIWALSYSTVLGKANVAGEISYRENAPVMRGNVARTPDREEIIHMHLNTIMVFEPTAFWDFSSFTAEFVAWHIPGRKNFSINDMSNKDRLAVQNSANGSGLGFLWTLEYRNVFSGIDLVVPVYLSHGIDGAMFTTGYRNHQTTVSLGLTGKYMNNLEVGFAYATYFGETDELFQMMHTDRDNVSLNMKYGF